MLRLYISGDISPVAPEVVFESTSTRLCQRFVPLIFSLLRLTKAYENVTIYDEW
jgi:hypothetical protein